MAEKRYLAAKTVSDVWICYPWEATYVCQLYVHGLELYSIGSG